MLDGRGGFWLRERPRRVVGLWRYPVKSMARRALRATCTSATRGIAGDRRYALVDALTGKVASAKNPRLWPTLLRCGARYLEHAGHQRRMTAPVEITLPDGDGACERRPGARCRALGRRSAARCALSSAAPPQPELEEYWPDLDELAHRDEITEEAMPRDDVLRLRHRAFAHHQHARCARGRAIRAATSTSRASGPTCCSTPTAAVSSPKTPGSAVRFASVRTSSCGSPAAPRAA